MKLAEIVGWLDGVLEPEKFDDVSNNGIQIERTGDEVTKVAFAVDGSARSVRAAADAGAQLLVVHHGISWGGGIRRIAGGEYAVVKAALDANVALYASHLPLDANRRCGNNWEIARAIGLTDVIPAFSYHGNTIGVAGVATADLESLEPLGRLGVRAGRRIGVCSGGAAEFAATAKALFQHPNTVRYRLTKIQKLMGLEGDDALFAPMLSLMINLSQILEEEGRS